MQFLPEIDGLKQKFLKEKYKINSEKYAKYIEGFRESQAIDYILSNENLAKEAKTEIKNTLEKLDTDFEFREKMTQEISPRIFRNERTKKIYENYPEYRPFLELTHEQINQIYDKDKAFKDPEYRKIMLEIMQSIPPKEMQETIDPELVKTASIATLPKEQALLGSFKGDGGDASKFEVWQHKMKQELSPIERVLYYINVPTQTTSYLVDRAIQGEEANPWHRHSYSKLLRDIRGNEKSDMLDVVVGGLADIFLDPITLVSFAMKLGGKVSKAPQVAKTIKALKIAGKPSDLSDTAKIGKAISNIDKTIDGIQKGKIAYSTAKQKTQVINSLIDAKTMLNKYQKQPLKLQKKLAGGLKKFDTIEKKIKAGEKLKQKTQDIAPGFSKKFISDDSPLKSTKHTKETAERLRQITQADRSRSPILQVETIGKADTISGARQSHNIAATIIDHDHRRLENSLRKMARRQKGNVKQNYRKINTGIIEAIETGRIEKLPRDQQRIARYFERELDRIYRIEKTWNKNLKKTSNYVPRIVDNPELIKNKEIVSTVLNPIKEKRRGDNVLDMTIREINNTLNRSGERAKLINDIPEILARKQSEVLRKNLIYNVQNKVQYSLIDTQKKGYIEVIHPILTGNKKKYMPKEIFNKVSDLLELSSKDIKFLDTLYNRLVDWTNVWKGWNLSLRPKYHFNNVFTNLFNNHVAGVKNKFYKTAFDIQNGKRIAIRTPGGLVPVDLKKLKELGITGGKYGKDFNLAQIKRIQKKNIPQKLASAKPVQKGFEFGSYMEDNTRMAHFLSKLEETGNIQTAQQSVKRYLYNFDPANLTQFEQKVMRVVFPFYSFTKYNIPNSVKNVLTHPYKMKRYYNIKNVIEGSLPKHDLSLQDDRIRQTSKIAYDVSPEGRVKYITMVGPLDFLELGEVLAIAENPIEATTRFIMQRANPLLKEVISQAINYDIETGRRIDFNEAIGREAETRTYLGIRMPKRLAHVLANFSLLNAINKANPGDKFGTRDSLSVFGELSRSPKLSAGKKMTDLIISSDFSYDLRRSYYRSRGEITKRIGSVKRDLRHKIKVKNSSQSATVKKKINKEIENLRNEYKKEQDALRELDRLYKEAQKNWSIDR
jgi:hypothetical protein